MLPTHEGSDDAVLHQPSWPNQEFETNGQSRQPTSLESAVSLKLRMIGHCIMVRFQGMDTYRN